jgi:uncharacterized protein (DUF885 family)
MERDIIMKIQILKQMLIAFFATGLLACSEEQDLQSQQDAALGDINETSRLSLWLDEQYEESLLRSPMELTMLGRPERKDEIDDMSVESFLEELAWYEASVAEMLESFDYEKLTDDGKLSFDLWVRQYERQKDSVPFIYSGLTFDQMNGAQSFFPTFLINFHSVAEYEDMLSYIARIQASGRAAEQLLTIARESSKKGVRTPLFALKEVEAQSQKIITGAPFDDNKDSDIWADMKTEIDTLLTNEKITQEQADSLLAQGEVALVGSFKPAYESIISWARAEEDLAPKISSGIGSQPDGEAYYNYLLARTTTTDLTADEIHEIGLAEVARLRQDMEKIKEQVGFEGSLHEFFAHIRDGKFNYYPDTDEGRQAYIDDATTVIENIKRNLPLFFNVLPKADLVVKRVEPFREQDGAAQHYYSGTPDGSRPGIYYAHLSDMTAMPKNQLENIAYHEGIPGHHMQISIAQELKNIPKFRTQLGFTAYVEGWALYSELLATEFPDTYSDPYSRFGQLTGESWRAIRLVVDTGLHSKGWTEQEAIDYFAENSPEPIESITSEIRRYIVYPGQATGYKIGMLKFLELRHKAQEALGDKFDLRGYHDTVLAGGALPLDLLERRVDQWIDELKNN